MIEEVVKTITKNNPMEVEVLRYLVRHPRISAYGDDSIAFETREDAEAGLKAIESIRMEKLYLPFVGVSCTYVYCDDPAALNKAKGAYSTLIDKHLSLNDICYRVKPKEGTILYDIELEGNDGLAIDSEEFTIEEYTQQLKEQLTILEGITRKDDGQF